MTVEQLAAAIPAATAMDIKEKERVCDMILATQPNLLASVLALRSFGISMPTIEIVLNILIVLHLAIVESGQVLATVTEDDQDRELSRYTASVRFAEGLDAASFMRSLEQTTAAVCQEPTRACAIRFGDRRYLLDHLVSARERRRWDVENDTFPFNVSKRETCTGPDLRTPALSANGSLMRNRPASHEPWVRASPAFRLCQRLLGFE